MTHVALVLALVILGLPVLATFGYIALAALYEWATGRGEPLGEGLWIDEHRRRVREAARLRPGRTEGPSDQPGPEVRP